jgi:cytochrome c oxidase subunit 4
MTEATHSRPHPRPRDYWVIAAILAVVTAAEVTVAYLPDSMPGRDAVVVPTLIVMAALKFFLVVTWFMHLKFDRPIYRRLFLIGLVAAPILFGAVLLAFGIVGS